MRLRKLNCADTVQRIAAPWHLPHGGHVIARIWRGYTRPEDADAYEAMLKPQLLPGLEQAKGYIGSFLGKRLAKDEVEFITVMFWESIEAIQAIAGPEFERAVVPKERLKYLVRYDATSAHYDIQSMQGGLANLDAMSYDPRSKS
jgi:heme-degrading monooxygenase HmoA